MSLDYSAIGVTTSGLAMLVVRAFAGEPAGRVHALLAVTSLVGFAVHVITSRILIASRNAKITS